MVINCRILLERKPTNKSPMNTNKTAEILVHFRKIKKKSIKSRNVKIKGKTFIMKCYLNDSTNIDSTSIYKNIQSTGTLKDIDINKINNYGLCDLVIPVQYSDNFKDMIILLIP